MTTTSDVARCVVATALQGVRDRAEIHYTQGPARWSGIAHHVLGPHQPPEADCSAYTTWLIWQARVRVRHGAGADVVNGLGWLAGYTGTQIQHGRRHRFGFPRFWQPGRTLVFYGGAVVEHVAVYVGGGMVVSHGSELGPLYLPWNYRPDVNQARLYAV